MKLLVSALIGTFGNDAYNVTILYGDANSQMIPVSACEISDSCTRELACKLSSELILDDILSNDNVRDTAYYYNSKTIGSHSKATLIEELINKKPSGNWILSSFNKIGIDDLNQLLEKFKAVLSTPEYMGKITCCGNLLNVPITLEL